MLKRKAGTQLKVHYVTIEDLVPSEHFLRKVEKLIDFSFIYDEVEHLYCSNNGRPSVDPVSLIKYLLIGFLYGIDSERRIGQEIQVNVAFRWFLGLELDEKVPDHSTISQLRRRKFNGTGLFRKIFEHILAVCMKQGLIDGKLILTDFTHIKANASRKSEIKVEVEKGTTAYWERLNNYEEIERQTLEAANKIPPKKQCRKPKSTPKMVEKTISTTDPDAGLLSRPGKPDGMHYLDHQSIDAKNGISDDAPADYAYHFDTTSSLDR